MFEFDYHVNVFLGIVKKEQGTCSTSSKCGNVDDLEKKSADAASLALQPIQSDLLQLQIRPAGGPDYNIHELPSVDGELIFGKFYTYTFLPANIKTYTMCYEVFIPFVAIIRMKI